MQKSYTIKELKSYINRFAYSEELSTYDLDSVFELLKLAGVLNEELIQDFNQQKTTTKNNLVPKIPATGIALSYTKNRGN